MGAGQHGQHGFVGNGQDASAGAYAGGPGHDQPPDMVGDVARQVLAELAGGQNWGRYRDRRMPAESSSEERRVGKAGVSKCGSRGSRYHEKKKRCTISTVDVS